jgi:hypothetical protein
MAGLSAVERLKFVLSVDSDGAIKAFEKVGKTADKELTKAQTASDKTAGKMQKVGSGAMAAAGIAGVALFEVSKKWEEAALSAGKLADATGLTTEEASRWSDVARDADVDTGVLESSIGKMEKALGKTPDKFVKLGIATKDAAGNQLSMSDVMLNSIDVLNGMQDPAQRAVVASELFGKGYQGMAELTGKSADELRERLAKVGGGQIFTDSDVEDAKKYRDSLNDLGDAFDTLVMGIGKGAAPVFGILADLATGIVEVFGSVDAVSGGAAGTFATLSAVAVGAVGSISLVAGSVMKMKDRFVDADGALTGFGKTAKGVVGGLAVLGAALAVGQVLDEITENADGAEDALNKFVVTAKGLEGSKNQTKDLTKAWEEFSDKAEDSKGVFSKLKDNLVTNFMLVENTLERLQNGFDKIMDTDPEMAKGIVTALENMQRAANNGDEEAKGWLETHRISTEQIAEFRDKVNNASDAQDILTKYTAEGTVEEQKAAAAIEEHNKQLQQEAKDLQAAAKALEEQIDAQRSAADAGYAMRDAQDAFAESIDGVGKALQEAGGDSRKIDKVYRDVASSAADVADATQRVYEEQAKASGTTITATQKIDIWNQAMLNSAATAKGPARTAILDFIAASEGISPEKTTKIKALVDAGKIEEAMILLTEVSKTREVALIATADTEQANADLDTVAGKPRTARISANVVDVTRQDIAEANRNKKSYAQAALDYQAALERNARGQKEPVALASGGVVSSPTIALIGEAGPEAVVPLGQSGKLGSTFNITINTGADPNQVISAIKRYTKNGGVL